MTARHDDLRAATRTLDFDYISAQPLIKRVALAWHLLFARQDGLGAPQVDANVLGREIDEENFE